MNVDGELRRTVIRGIGAVGAIAGTTAVVAGPSTGAVAAAEPQRADPVPARTVSASPTATPGTYESCTALFGLAAKDQASWVQFDVVENRPVTPPVTIGTDLQAIVTVHGGDGQADVDCEADVPAWTTEAEWLEFVRVQRGASNLDTITGRYPYPGGPGYAIPGVGTTYSPGVANHLTEAITVKGASVRFLEDSVDFSVVSGSPQDLTNLSRTDGSAAAKARVVALDADFDDTVQRCAVPVTATPEAVTAAVAALGSVWGIDVDEMFPPASSSIEDRCATFGEAQLYYFATATRALTVGATATVTVEPPPPPTTSTTTTVPSPTPSTTAAAAADQVAPAFTG